MISSLTLSSFAFRLAHGVHNDVSAAGAGDAHVTREVLELQLSVGANRDGTVDSFAFCPALAGTAVRARRSAAVMNLIVQA